jgi:hypothetical protein
VTIEQMERVGEISGFEIFIDETQDVLATGVLEVQVKIRPTAYLNWIVINLSYANPQFQTS